jgi:hypothetical protein
MPIHRSSDVAAMTRFYQALGLQIGSVSRPGGWVELPAEGGMLAIHRGSGEDVGRCKLGFRSQRTTGEADEGFGHSRRVQDPDRVWVQINLYDRELYT